MSPPAISVAMAVHNARPYLADSIESILAQSFEDFELVVVENGSSDGSPAVLRRYAQADRRVRVLECPHALGPAGGSNRAVRESAGAIVAPMDADDVSHPDRLARQYQVLAADPGVAVVGTLAVGIDAAGRRVRPADRSELFRRSAFPLSHGSVMFRRADFEAAGGFRAAAEPWEDLDLFLRLADHGRVTVLTQPLYRYRYHAASVTGSYAVEESARAGEVLALALAQRRAGRDHDSVLASAGPAVSADARVAALHRRGVVRLWSGSSPGVLREMLACGPRCSRVWLANVAWAVWGAVSPRTLRALQRCVVRARDLAARVRLGGAAVHEWRLR